MKLDGDADVQKAIVAEVLGTLLFQFFVGFSKGDALAAGISFGVLRMFPALIRFPRSQRHITASKSLLVLSSCSHPLDQPGRQRSKISCLCPVYGTQQISGGHLNPALTLAMVAGGYFHWVTALIYIVAQAIFLPMILSLACPSIGNTEEASIFSIRLHNLSCVGQTVHCANLHARQYLAYAETLGTARQHSLHAPRNLPCSVSNVGRQR